jgi:hypothetical protein
VPVVISAEKRRGPVIPPIPVRRDDDHRRPRRDLFGVAAERKGLEDIAEPLTAADARDRDRSFPAAAAA